MLPAAQQSAWDGTSHAVHAGAPFTCRPLLLLTSCAKACGTSCPVGHRGPPPSFRRSHGRCDCWLCGSVIFRPSGGPRCTGCEQRPPASVVDKVCAVVAVHGIRARLKGVRADVAERLLLRLSTPAAAGSHCSGERRGSAGVPSRHEAPFHHVKLLRAPRCSHRDVFRAEPPAPP